MSIVSPLYRELDNLPQSLVYGAIGIKKWYKKKNSEQIFTLLTDALCYLMKVSFILRFVFF